MVRYRGIFCFFCLVVSAFCFSFSVCAHGDDVVSSGGSDAQSGSDPISSVLSESEAAAEGVEALSLSPAAELSETTGDIVGCSFIADCVLGDGLSFYVSPDKIDFLRVDADGYIFNCSDTTVYLAVVGDVETYTISASRFSRFSYRTGNYNYSDLQLRASDSTVLPQADSVGAPLDTPSIILICSGIFLLFSVIVRRSFSYG